MRETITISVPKSIKQKLDSLTKKEHLNRSDIVREALRQFFVKQEFRSLRHIMVPKAEQAGIYTDEDVFHRVS
ncbi:MAG: CopG family transcriptional regulator [Planctomycetes bacterium]|nr:CopG family transcriptional regulator [Planctomycetota bacterium]